jgi:histidinol phosphatase-like enzyme (inositol monophosphatase family)
VQEILNFAHKLAWEAGKITLRYFQTEMTTYHKEDDSPVTIADRESELFLRDSILRRYPDHSVLGEEDGESGNPDATWRWIVDPIDGTKAFVHGMPLYGVMIGVEREGVPVIGVVNMPALGEIVYAGAGLGCWWNGRRCYVSPAKRLADGLVTTTSATRYGREGMQDVYDRFSLRAGLFRTWGDCYGYLLVATGRAVAMLDPVMNLWDAAALLRILQEAGGTFTDWNGRPRIDSGNGIGTNGLVFQELMRVVKGEE